MSRLSLERPCAVPPAQALQRLEGLLGQRGYQSAARSDLERQWLYAAGDPAATVLHRCSHRLTVRCEPRRLTFVFEASAQSGRAEPTVETGPLEARVDEAMQALGRGATGASAAGQVRCTTCGALVATGTPECSVCGSRL